jgi:predicted CoA-binding protein
VKYQLHSLLREKMKTTIEHFIRNKEVALVGASQNQKKWGNMLFRELKKKGYTVYPVNLNATEIEGVKCYPTIGALPPEIRNAIIVLPPEITEQIVKECVQSGINRVWLHKGAGGKGASSKIAIEFCKANGIEVVYDLCPLMFFPPVGMHKVHFWLKRLVGRMPEDLK